MPCGRRLAVPNPSPRPLFTRQFQGWPERHAARDPPKCRSSTSSGTTGLEWREPPRRHFIVDDLINPARRPKPCPIPSLNDSEAGASQRKSQILPLHGIRKSLSASGRHPSETGIGVEEEHEHGFLPAGLYRCPQVRLQATSPQSACLRLQPPSSFSQKSADTPRLPNFPIN